MCTERIYFAKVENKNNLNRKRGSKQAVGYFEPPNMFYGVLLQFTNILGPISLYFLSKVLIVCFCPPFGAKTTRFIPFETPDEIK